MSFWRNQILQLGVGLATFPVAAIVGALLFGAIYQFVDFTKNTTVFFAIAFPFLISWMIADRWIIRRIERRRGSKGENVQENPDP